MFFFFLYIYSIPLFFMFYLPYNKNGIPLCFHDEFIQDFKHIKQLWIL